MHVVDTAGLRESDDLVERMGIERAWSSIERADMVVHMIDATKAGTGGASQSQQLPPDLPRITVVNKIDLMGLAPSLETGGGRTTVWLSARTGAGIDLLRQALLVQAGWEGHAETVYLARSRHLNALGVAQRELDRAAGDGRPELVAEHLRLAHEALSSITGEFTADDLLAEIFQRFCIGK
jgi:tRNA modification GTPase